GGRSRRGRSGGSPHGLLPARRPRRGGRLLRRGGRRGVGGGGLGRRDPDGGPRPRGDGVRGPGARQRLARARPQGAGRAGPGAWGIGFTRSTTTRVTYSGVVWNCETRTRETASSLTAIVRCLTSFLTPGRSTTIRGGFARAKSLAENQPSPTSTIATLPPRVS